MIIQNDSGFLTEGAGFYFQCKGEAMVCPICHEEWVHIEKVEVNRLGEVTVVGSARPVDFVKKDTHARGSIVATYFYCENGHHWKEIREFHEGCVFEDIVRLPDLKDMDELVGELPRE